MSPDTCNTGNYEEDTRAERWNILVCSMVLKGCFADARAMGAIGGRSKFDEPVLSGFVGFRKDLVIDRSGPPLSMNSHTGQLVQSDTCH